VRKRFLVEKPGASDKEYEEDWRRTHTQQTKWWITQETTNELLSRFGVFCTSAIEDNHLMRRSAVLVSEWPIQ
jgi:hypothetical protein